MINIRWKLVMVLNVFSFIFEIGVSGFTLPLNFKSSNSGQLFFILMLLNKWSLMIKIKIVKKRKNLRTEKRKKFKNFISVIFKYKFFIHLGKKIESCLELPSCVRIYPNHMLCIFFFHKIEKCEVCLHYFLFKTKQNSVLYR